MFYQIFISPQDKRSAIISNVVLLVPSLNPKIKNLLIYLFIYLLFIYLLIYLFILFIYSLFILYLLLTNYYQKQ